MYIGIPNEVAAEERRVALTPVGAYALTRKGHHVYIEHNAGESSGFPDQAFKEVGAEILYSHEEVFRRAEILVKVQSPSEDESLFLDKGQVVLSFLNLGMTQKSALRRMMENEVTAFGYEIIRNTSGNPPVLMAMSEIAGCLLPQIAGRLLESQRGGRGVLLSGVAGIPAAAVVILGAGVVGFHAARAFSQLGASVMVLDRDIERLSRIDEAFNKRVVTSIVTPYNVERFVRIADVLIGAVAVQGQKTPHLVSKQLVSEMRKGTAIVDVSIDQGGCVETSRLTTLSDPVFEKLGVNHYCVPNIPSSVARTASYALNNAVTPRVLEIAESGVTAAIGNNRGMREGVYLHQGRCTKEAISEYCNLEFEAIDAFLK